MRACGRRSVAVLVAFLLASAACGNADDEIGEAPTVPSLYEIISDFTTGVAGTASCAELFSLRNELGSTSPYYAKMNEDLRIIGCFSSSSDRNQPTSTTAESKQYDQAAFNSFMEAALAGTSYAYYDAGTPAWDISAQVYEGSAELICSDLAQGEDEADLRRETTERERLGDPDLDRDIPTYVDAIFEAARTFVCPDS